MTTVVMSCYYDCEDYVSDIPHNYYDAESLYSKDFDWGNFTLNGNLEEADKKIHLSKFRLI